MVNDKTQVVFIFFHFLNHLQLPALCEYLNSRTAPPTQGQRQENLDAEKKLRYKILAQFYYLR